MLRRLWRPRNAMTEGAKGYTAMTNDITMPCAVVNGPPRRRSTGARRFSDEDLRGLMGEVARILLGTPNRGLSRGKEMRYGTRGSLSIDLAKGVWRDHETGEGGGVLDLIERETQLRGDARFDWLRESG